MNCGTVEIHGFFHEGKFLPTKKIRLVIASDFLGSLSDPDHGANILPTKHSATSTKTNEVTMPMIKLNFFILNISFKLFFILISITPLCYLFWYQKYLANRKFWFE
jgi:hypothetical protein